MKSQWWIYVIVGVIAALAAVAIAGLPDTTSTDATIVAPATTTSTTLPATTTAPTTTEAPAPKRTTTVAPSTEPPATEPPATEPSEPATTVAPTTTVAPLVRRADLFVVVANGAEVSGLAGRTRDELLELGYRDVVATDGSVLTDLSVVYHAEGLEREALRLARDLAFPTASILPLADAPEVSGSIDGVQLLPYLGRDQG